MNINLGIIKTQSDNKNYIELDKRCIHRWNFPYRPILHACVIWKKNNKQRNTSCKLMIRSLF